MSLPEGRSFQDPIRRGRPAVASPVLPLFFSDRMLNKAGPVGTRTGTGGAQMPWKRIYKHYNLLIDFCFWVQFVVISKSALQGLKVLPTPLYPFTPLGDALYYTQLTFHFLTFFAMPILLYFSRFRDEYAERLWQKSAASITRLMLVMPFVWFAGWETAKALFGGREWMYGIDLPAFMLQTSVEQYAAKNPGLSPGLLQLIQIDKFLIELFFWFPLTLATIYKWHRWRDGE